MCSTWVGIPRSRRYWPSRATASPYDLTGLGALFRARKEARNEAARGRNGSGRSVRKAAGTATFAAGINGSNVKLAGRRALCYPLGRVPEKLSGGPELGTTLW